MQVRTPMPKGLLLVMMEPPAALEEEFHDWYDGEHLPQRRALPGFENGSRWVCLSGWPRWLAIYDLASTAVLETEGYKAVSGPHSTPWSRRILPRTIGRQRVVAEQIHPGEELALSPDSVARLCVARFVGDLGAAPLRQVGAATGLVQLRLFRDETSVWAMAGFDRPVSADAATRLFAEVAGAGPVLSNLYAPYRRR